MIIPRLALGGGAAPTTLTVALTSLQAPVAFEPLPVLSPASTKPTTRAPEGAVTVREPMVQTHIRSMRRRP